MSALGGLLSCAGSWAGTYLLQMSLDDPGVTSDTTLVVTSVLQDRFDRLDQTWVWQGQPQEGTMLIGHVPDGEVAAHWADTWHNGHSVLSLSGPASADGTVDVLGSYPAPSGPDWGWRIRIEPAGDGLTIRMFNIHPEGTEVPGGSEVPAVTAEYRRSR